MKSNLGEGINLSKFIKSQIWKIEKRKSKNGGSLCGRAPRRQLSRRSEGGSRPALSAPLRSFMRRCCCYGRSAAVSRCVRSRRGTSSTPQSQCSAPRRPDAVCVQICPVLAPPARWPRPTPPRSGAVPSDCCEKIIWHLQPCARVRNPPESETTRKCDGKPPPFAPQRHPAAQGWTLQGGGLAQRLWWVQIVLMCTRVESGFGDLATGPTAFASRWKGEVVNQYPLGCSMGCESSPPVDFCAAFYRGNDQ